MEPHSHSRIEYMIKAKSQFKQRSTANNVEILIPVPSDADTPSFKTSIGTVKYAPERDAIVWTIKQFHGGKEYLMRAHFGLPSVSNEEDKKDKLPITVKFEIPYFTVSGIRARAPRPPAAAPRRPPLPRRPRAPPPPPPRRPPRSAAPRPAARRCATSRSSRSRATGAAVCAVHHAERRLPPANVAREAKTCPRRRPVA